MLGVGIAFVSGAALGFKAVGTMLKCLFWFGAARDGNAGLNSKLERLVERFSDRFFRLRKGGVVEIVGN